MSLERMLVRKGDGVAKPHTYFDWNDMDFRTVTIYGHVVWSFWPLCKVKWRRWAHVSRGHMREYEETHFVWNVLKGEAK